MALLEIRNLKKGYRQPDGQEVAILEVPHLAVEESRQVGLAGRSGSGKTTLLHLIAGILKADSGQVLLDGTDLQSCSEANRDRIRAEQLGYVFQSFHLLQGYSALENVLLGMMFGGKADVGAATQLLQRLGMGDRLHHRPRQLSVGQQQRVAVARALANRPRLVLADEPTGNLDPAHAMQAMGLLSGVCREQGAALLLVSHDPAILEQMEENLDLSELNQAQHGTTA